MRGRLYVPGESFIYRLPPGIKMAFLALSATFLFFVQDWKWLAAGLFSILCLYKCAKLTWKLAWAQVRPMLSLFIVFFLVYTLFYGWFRGAAMIVRLTDLTLGAALVTLTSPVSRMHQAIVSGFTPFRCLGVNPEKIGLAFSMALRFLPAISQISAAVREAQHARGLDKHFIALVVPVIVRSFKMGEDIADAHRARSFDE